MMVLLLLPAVGQLKHVKGISNAGITCGTSGNGTLFGAGYSHYLQPKWIVNVNALYENGKVESTRFKNLIVNAGMDYTCFEAGEFLYLNAGLSLFAGSEKLTGEDARVGEKKNITFGPAGNINAELYVSPAFLFQLKAEQYYSPLSDLGKWFPVYSLSLKYCF